MDALAQTQQLIKESKEFSKEDKANLLKLIDRIPKQKKQEALGVIIKDPKILKDIIENYNKKVEILSSKNREKARKQWDKLMKEEEKMLRKILK